MYTKDGIDYITVEDMADYFSLNRNTISKWHAQGKMPRSSKSGKSGIKLWTQESVKEWLSAKKKEIIKQKNDLLIKKAQKKEQNNDTPINKKYKSHFESAYCLPAEELILCSNKEAFEIIMRAMDGWGHKV